MLNTPCTAGAVALADTGFGYTLSLIGGKYKMVILFWLGTQPSIRFNELQRRIGGISYKSLTAALQFVKAYGWLERDGLVSRTVFPQVPPRVEYALTARGQSLLPVLNAMCAWGEAHRATVATR